ncbi:hypothetical protein NQ318_020067 [Aromia moschata]|uniref:Very-long-chain (3R)-3-hydroxyacyl-CoA dehydratase n=1 Tax=Aromia moschata TaxID=1265417 RepID=A0AAV8ZAH7_9CUCU|nr:hypothetical protein NQ318_020067 [Aromia moschata]
MANKSSKTSDKNSGPSTIAQTYLIAYNAVLAVGWTYLLYQLITYYLTTSDKSLYETVKCSLFIFQNAAVMEVIHAATGMVKSNPVLTAFQVASRVIVVCGILFATTAGRNSIGLPLALTAWSVTEIIRYSTYTLNLMGVAPYFLKWLRYSLFIGLYPLGITGGAVVHLRVQREIGEGQLYSIALPNTLNFTFNYQYALWILMFLYIPLFPQLYLHMFSQRKKVLGTERKNK